jgi:uncharacterized membrane protein
MNKKKSTIFIVQFSILLAIEAIFCFTPLGSIPIGPIVATLAMIPVIITALLLGAYAGTLMGFFAGLFSFLVWTFMPPNPVAAFVFTPFYSLGEMNGNVFSLIICFVPRALVGTVAGVTYKAFSKLMPNKDIICFSLSAILGSLTNTFGVLLGIWLFFGKSYSAVFESTMLYIVGFLILTNGIPEAIVSAIAAPAVCKPLKIAASRKDYE